LFVGDGIAVPRITEAAQPNQPQLLPPFGRAAANREDRGPKKSNRSLKIPRRV